MTRCTKCGDEGHVAWECRHAPERAAKMLAAGRAQQRVVVRESVSDLNLPAIKATTTRRTKPPKPGAPNAPKPGHKARLLAPVGDCAYCDARRAHSRAAMSTTRSRRKGKVAP